MEPELAGATVAVVPVRFGSGTRVKILESFAHRVPVVSTTLGAEGLDVEDGVHLLWPTIQRSSPRPPCGYWATPGCGFA